RIAAALRASYAETEMAQLERVITIPPATLRTMLRTPRGRDYSYKYAFMQMPYHEYARTPVLLTAYQTARLGAFAAEPTPEQDEIVWRLFETLLTGYTRGTFSKAQGVQLFLTWKGALGFLGWGSVGSTLPPEVRGPTAYLMGLRFVRLNDRKGAES